MLRRGAGGKIILVASLTSQVGIPNTAPYAAAKSGVLGLVRTLAVEWAPHAIQVNAIAPGYFHTALTDALFSDPERRDKLLSRIPMGRIGEPDDLAGAIVFLASSASNYMTGQVINVDGGWLAG
jgi:2-dehydro-3-deoxy-D-gluconate 5-dehydrogenase